jgi:hypothetical protein
MNFPGGEERSGVAVGAPASRIIAGYAAETNEATIAGGFGMTSVRCSTIAGISLRIVQQLALTLAAGDNGCTQQSWLGARAGDWHLP